MNRTFTWIICLAVCGFLNAAEPHNLFMDPPTIQPNESSLTLEPGTNVSIKCSSAYPITWKPFEGFTGTYLVSYETEEVAQIGSRYESSIHLINITYFYVGHFFCVANRTQSDYDYDLALTYLRIYLRYSMGFSGLSSVYIFVRDDNHLLVRREVPEVTVVASQFLIVTCKPTSKDTEIMLYEGRTNLNFGHYYDATIGFVVQFEYASQIYGKSLTCMPYPHYHSNDVIIFTVTYHVAYIGSTGVAVAEGEQLTLNCSIDILKEEIFTINWNWPNKNMSLTEKRVNESVQTINHLSEPRFGVSTITISDVVMKDEGYYECEVIDHFKNRLTQQLFINIWRKGDDSIELYTVNNTNKFLKTSWRQVAAQVRYKGNPKPSLVWYDNLNQTIQESGKYNIFIANDYTVLAINGLTMEDFGVYTLKATNPLDSKEIKLELFRNFIPHAIVVRAEGAPVQIGDIATFFCNCFGYPLPTVTWTFTPCMAELGFKRCDESLSTKIEEQHIQTRINSGFAKTSELSLKVTEFGKVRCSAVNTEWKSESEEYVNFVFKQAVFRVTGLAEDTVICAGDNITVICEASSELYRDVFFNRDGLVTNSSNRIVENSHSEELRRVEITWTGMEMEDSGTYECVTIDIFTEVKRIQIFIKVNEPKLPEIDGKNYVKETVIQTLGASFPLHCNIIGLPIPEIKWYKNDQFIKNSTRFSVVSHTLHITNSEMDDGGEFSCVGENRLGTATKSIQLNITHMYRWLAGGVMLVLAFVICSVYLLARYRRIRRELSFEKGNPDSINPDLTLEEQADLLPYNKKYEFPRKKLKLGKQLGTGAFGVVVEGLATGILAYEDNTKVAVKMLKETAGSEEIRALVTELKIMANLGQHLNIVNLLGAVTKNIAKRNILVIVEYCRFGNLHSFLMKHRKTFIDQINTESDSIDPTISTIEWRNSHENGCESNSNEPVGLSYQNLCTEVDGGNTESSFMKSACGPSITAPNEIHPIMFITTSDLVCWLFQVARGMKYLSSRKVLHCDLAARNILLSDDNVVKICDFGLAKSLYKCDIYKKEGNAPLPIKWLAIESVCDLVFSTFSDVWSFGILMWEVFSLGATPYPGMDLNQDLFVKLKDGYRMEKPTYATTKIYDLMLHCWNLNPESRPLFDALADRLGKLLETGVAERYVDLNHQYLEMNPENFQQGQTEYLSIMGSQEEMTNVVKSDATVYLPMTPVLCNDVANAASNCGYAVSAETVERGTFSSKNSTN